jgi:hypothetical protein
MQLPVFNYVVRTVVISSNYGVDSDNIQTQVNALAKDGYRLHSSEVVGTVYTLIFEKIIGYDEMEIVEEAREE